MSHHARPRQPQTETRPDVLGTLPWRSGMRARDGESVREELSKLHQFPTCAAIDSSPARTNCCTSNSGAPPVQLARPAPAGKEDGCRTCNVPYSQDDGLKGSWIGCDGCKAWHHARCVDLDQSQVDKIDKFYCHKCEPVFGKSTRELRWILKMALAN